MFMENKTPKKYFKDCFQMWDEPYDENHTLRETLFVIIEAENLHEAEKIADTYQLDYSRFNYQVACYSRTFGSQYKMEEKTAQEVIRLIEFCKNPSERCSIDFVPPLNKESLEALAK